MTKLEPETIVPTPAEDRKNKAGGAGWQTRIDDELRRLVAKRG